MEQGNLMKTGKIGTEQYFKEGQYLVNLTDEERRYLALEEISPEYETVTCYSRLHTYRRRTVLFYKGDVIVKVIHEEYDLNQKIEEHPEEWPEPFRQMVMMLREGMERKENPEAEAYQGLFRERSYLEFDTNLETEHRKLLLPRTKRGKPVSVTPANVLNRRTKGCSFCLSIPEPPSIHWRNGSQISVYNSRNHRALAIGEEDSVSGIRCEEDFHRFMERYMATCPADYAGQLYEVKHGARQTVHFDTGAVFRCQVDRTRYAYGLVIGRVRELLKWKELPENHSFCFLMGQPVLIRLYDFITENGSLTPEELRGKPLCGVQICSDAPLLWGEHEIIGYQRLRAEDIQFPLNLVRCGGVDSGDVPFIGENSARILAPKRQKRFERLLVEWGFAQLSIPVGEVPEEIKDMLNGEEIYYSAGTDLGIDTSVLSGEEDSNVLFRPGRRRELEMVMQFLGISVEKMRLTVVASGKRGEPGSAPFVGELFDAFARRYGGLTREDYISRVE